LFQFFAEQRTAYLLGSEGDQMAGIHLAVDHPEFPFKKLSDKVNQATFRGISFTAEHGFPEKHLSDGDAVESAYQGVLQPDLHGMCVSKLVQTGIGLYHLPGNPGPVFCSTRLGAGIDNPQKILVESDPKRLVSQCLA
jgi:hypothetical protein